MASSFHRCRLVKTLFVHLYWIRLGCFGKLLAGSLQSLVFSARARSLVCFESRKLTELSGCVITYSVPVLSVEACCKCGGGDILLFVVPIIRDRKSVV